MNSKKVTKEDIVSIVSKLFYVSEEEILKAPSLSHIVHQSLDRIELVCALEDHYHIKLDFEEAESLLNLDQAIKYLQRKVDKAVHT